MLKNMQEENEGTDEGEVVRLVLPQLKTRYGHSDLR